MITSLTQHAPHPWFEVVDDVLQVAGRSLLDIAAEVGRTPFYVYDGGVMTRKVAPLRSESPSGIHIHYAVKANPKPETVRHFAEIANGLDVASGGELTVALAAGASPAAISFAGPGKTEAELHQAVAAGITVNVESEREIRLLAEIGRQGNRRPRLETRVNPDFELETSGMQVVRRNYPAVIGNHVNGVEREIASVVGPLCTPLDLLANRMKFATPHEGDCIVVLQSGAYGETASPTRFLSHPEPMSIVV